MRRWVNAVIVGCAVLWASGAVAQTPGIEMYGGLAYRDAYSGGARHGFAGLHGSIAFNETGLWGLMVAAGGQYRLSQGMILHAYDLMAGPQLVRRRQRFDISGHVLFGLVHGLARGLHEDFPGADLGSALDIHGSGLLALRLQADYVPNGPIQGNILYNDVRFTAGGILRLRR